MKAYLDFEKVFSWSLSDTEYGDDTGRLELEDVLDVDSLSYDQLLCLLAAKFTADTGGREDTHMGLKFVDRLEVVSIGQSVSLLTS